VTLQCHGAARRRAYGRPVEVIDLPLTREQRGRVTLDMGRFRGFEYDYGHARSG